MNKEVAMDMPTISVVIPTYNSRQYLAAALDSVLAQEYPAELIDIVVVDDGSRDDSASIAEAYAMRSPTRIQVIRQANAGQSAARNAGIAATRGELVAFLDSDDSWQPMKCMLQAALYRAQPEVGLIHCASRFVDPKGHELADYVRKSNTAQGDVLLEFFCDFFLITSAVMVPRHCLDEIGVFDESLRIGEDYDLFLRLVARWPAGCVEEPLLNRTIRADSLSREDFDLDARNDLAILDKFVQANPDFAQRHRDRVRARFADYLYDYGYRLLDAGDTARARTVLTQSMQWQASLGAAKALVRSMLPRSTWPMLRA